MLFPRSMKEGHHEVWSNDQLYSILEIDGALWSEDRMPRTEHPARFLYLYSILMPENTVAEIHFDF